MLSRDQTHFDRAFPSAAAFLRTAALRKEAYTLAMQQDRTPWEAARLEEILQAPACKEGWFLDLLTHDARRTCSEGF